MNTSNALPQIGEEMKFFYQAVKNHLEMNTVGALLITGDWGSGKTYFMKNILFPNLEKETNVKPILVSLYGATDKNSIANKVFMAYLDKLGNNKSLSMANIRKGAVNVLEASTWIKKYVDVNKLFANTGEELFRFLPNEGLLICFDDLERISTTINPEDFLGMVNELVENKGNKVVVIANEEHIEGGIKYKEKTIEKTIHFKNDQLAILKSLAVKYAGTTFGNYLISESGQIISTLSPFDQDGKELPGLKVLFGNIRSLKFAIEHFRYVFEIFQDKRNVDDELVKKQLKDIWAFILAVTIEFKKNDSISFNERKKLDVPKEPLTNDDLARILFGANKQEDVGEENDWSFRENFISQYFKRIDVEYRYSADIYDLLTSGRSIDPDQFLIALDEMYHVIDGAVDPAHDLLSRFVQGGYWKFTNEEFLPLLQQLFAYGKEGAFGDITSYFNAASFMLPFKELLGKTGEELTEAVKEGIDVAVKKIKLESAFNELDMAAGVFEGAELKELYDYALVQLKDARTKQYAEETAKLEVLFYNNLGEFMSELAPENPNIIVPERKLFDQFGTEGIEVALNIWQPTEIFELVRFLNRRYFSSGFADRLVSEIPFLEVLAEKLAAFENAGRPLSKQLIVNQLHPKVLKSIEKLQSFPQQEQ